MTRTFRSFDELKAALAALGPEDILPAVSLTPELAADILAHDPVNRKVRPGNLARIARDIQSGNWDIRKSPPLRFLTDSYRLGDGQHRCKAVVQTGMTITVTICLVPDTVGVDEGAARTLVDHLQLSKGLDTTIAPIAAAVTRALCHERGAGNRELLAFFDMNRPFILECATKPTQWLKDTVAVSSYFKPQMVAVLRAKAIYEEQESADDVDQLFVDAINRGETAPENSPRRSNAKQVHDGMLNAFERKHVKTADMLTWILSAVRMTKAQVVKNIFTTRYAGKRKPKAA